MRTETFAGSANGYFVGTATSAPRTSSAPRSMFDAVPPPTSAWPLRMIRNRPSGAMSYGRVPPRIGSIANSNNTCGRPATSVVPDCTGDRKHLPTVQAAEEQFPAVTRPEWETAAAGRDRLPISELRIPLDVDLGSTGHVRLVGHPASVWRDGRDSRCRSRFSPAPSRRTGARWRSARSRTECSAAPR